MKVHELIANLHDVDPDGESDVKIFFHRRYGSNIAEIAEISRWTDDGPVMVGDAADPEL